MVAEIIIYSTLVCPYCTQAKRLFDYKGVGYTEIRIDKEPTKVAEMVKKSGGRRSVPQIFIGDTHIGGFDDLKALNDMGKLDEILK
ncbi:MAG: glutaredoxin 3 [Francisellaceae bacterium]|nr:glutaredoxin 3 [Francisellaceae bacterium]MBT6207495.1 glutaredoxin 3 [Francisellaceae bacterium]MBT6538866.1 glutaredoxin 3 [Francisellaceae bacterium]